MSLNPVLAESHRKGADSRSQADARLLHFREQAISAQRQGHPSEALALFAQALAIDPERAELYSLRGSVLAYAKRWTEAASDFQSCLLWDPTFPDARFNLGVVLHQSGRIEEAAAAYREALRQCADPAPANNLGLALQQLGRMEEAVVSFQHALQIDPDHRDALVNLANAFKLAGRAEDSLVCYERLLSDHTPTAEFYFQAGVLKHQSGRKDEARRLYELALETGPHAESWNNLGLLLEEKDEVVRAEECYRNAGLLKPAYADSFCNLGNLLLNTGREADSLACYHDALRINPEDPAVRFNRSMALLAAGHWQEGWAEYRWRWKWKDFSTPVPKLNRPWWRGEDVQGKTVLLWCEQGIGDTLHFVRYASLLKSRGARTLLAAPRELALVLEGCSGVDKLLKHDEPIPAFDFHVPLLDLPSIFGSTPADLPAALPYLRVPDKSFMPLPETSGKLLKVGLIWAGGTHYPKDRWRSLQLHQLMPLLQVPGVAFYSLQVGPKRSQLEALPSKVRVTDIGGAVMDFRDTAAAMGQLDLVISTCTSTLHLAGAIGSPTWALLSSAPCWRWLRAGDRTPWYPNMRLFRQPVWGDWTSAIQKAAEALSELVAKGKSELF